MTLGSETATRRQSQKSSPQTGKQGIPGVGGGVGRPGIEWLNGRSSCASEDGL